MNKHNRTLLIRELRVFNCIRTHSKFVLSTKMYIYVSDLGEMFELTGD